MIKKIILLLLALALVIPTAYAAVEIDGTNDKLTLDDLMGEVEDMQKEEDFGKTFEGTVYVEESNVLRDTAYEINGHGIEWNASETNGIFESSSSTEFSPQWEEFRKGFKYMPCVRAAGHSTLAINWENAIGPLGERRPGDEGMDPANWSIGNNVLKYGLLEWVRDFQAFNKDVKFIVCLNVHYDTPEHLRDEVEFFIGDPETTKWGKKRAELGFYDPINVMAFELGNEVNGQFVDPKDYIKVARPTIDLIKRDFPEAKLAMSCYSYPLEMPIESMDWRGWNIEAWTALGKDCDYIQYHPYYDGQVNWTHETFLQVMKQDLYDCIGENNIQWLMTESSMWPVDGSMDPTKSGCMALVGALSTANFLNRCHNNPDVAATNYFAFWGFSKGAWGLVDEYDGRFYWNVTAEMHNVYGDHLGDKIFTSRVESDSEYIKHDSYSSQFSVLASRKSNKELSLILVNKSKALNFDLDFVFENDYTLTERTVFTADDYMAQLSAEQTDINEVLDLHTDAMEIPNFNHYMLPAKSMVCLTLKSDKVLGGGSGASSDEVVFEGEKTFEDIDLFWGKNEIEILRENGILHGKTETSFEPFANLTRAEFAMMIDNVVSGGKDEGEATQLFNDVPADAWYAKAVANLFGNGVMRGKSNYEFCPNDNVTLEEVVTVVARVREQLAGESEYADEKILDTFAYKSDIAEWAKLSILNSVKNGVLTKFYENGQFNPKKAATRGETAVMLYRLNNAITGE